MSDEKKLHVNLKTLKTKMTKKT